MIRRLLTPLLAVLLATPVLAEEEEFRVGYVRVMDDAQVMLA